MGPSCSHGLEVQILNQASSTSYCKELQPTYHCEKPSLFLATDHEVNALGVLGVGFPDIPHRRPHSGLLWLYGLLPDTDVHAPFLRVVAQGRSTVDIVRFVARAFRLFELEIYRSLSRVWYLVV